MKFARALLVYKLSSDATHARYESTYIFRHENIDPPKKAFGRLC